MKKLFYHRGEFSPLRRHNFRKAVVNAKQSKIYCWQHEGESTIKVLMQQLFFIRPLAVSVLLLSLLLLSVNSFAGDHMRLYEIDIAQQDVAKALTRLSEQVDVQVFFPYNLTKGKTANAIKGNFTVLQALDLMLKGSGLHGGISKNGVLTISLGELKGDEILRGDKSMLKSKKNLLAATVAFFVGVGGVNASFAQGDEGAKQRSGMDEIIVTATKRAQNIQDVPISILALQGDDLVNQGISDLQSLSLAVPGLLVVESGIQRRISIRGIGNSFGSSSLIGMYLDDASVASLPAYQIDLRIHDLERVEVLKGPQGTLYGEGSVGGTIRYITNDPQLDAFGAEASFDVSSTKDGDPSQETKAIINIPLIDDSLGLRVVSQYINSGGWIDQPALDKSDINDYELYNVRAKLLWLPSDNLEVKATAIVHRNDTGALTTGEDDSGNYSQAFGAPTTPSGEANYDVYSLLVNYDLGDMALVSSTSYLDADHQINNTGSECCFPTGTPGEFWHTLVTESNYAAEIFTQELRLSSNESDPWFWSTGLFYKDATLFPGSFEGGLFGVPGGTLGTDIFAFGGPSGFQEEQSQSWALFGETSYAVTDQLELGVGLRYFEDDRRFRRGVTGTFQEDTFDSLNPKVFAKYDINDDLNVYFNVAQGFRSGGFNGAGQPPYDPETVLSYELGSKMSSSDGRLKADVALFHSTYEDYQIVGVIPSLGLNVTSNGGEAEILGIDLSLVWYASEQLELGFNGNYMDTEFTEINVTSTSHAVGDAVDLVPQYGYSLWGNYAFNWSDQAAGFIRLDYSEQGKSNYRNRSFGPDYSDQSDVIEMLNMRLGWSYDDWSVDLYALNLLDEDGFVGPYEIEKGAARPRPRTVGLKLGIKF